MKPVHLAYLAAAGSAALLAGAFLFQFAGYAPCKMCLWQRYPHAVAAALGLALMALNHRIILWLGMLAALSTSAVGMYHVGVEKQWWEGPSSCTSGSIGGLSVDELLDKILAAPVVRCDEIAWELIGISMAGWNAIISLALAALWLIAALAYKRA
ncbi:MAG: disulfide bond formation protein B [Pseudomonadota bacterium]